MLDRHHKSGGLRGIWFFLTFFFLAAVVVLGLFTLFTVISSGNFFRADRFTVAVDGPKKFAVSLSISGKDAVIVEFPNNLYVPSVAHGYGQYPITKIYQVGELDHRGGEVYSDTVSQFMGIPVDGFVHSPRNFISLKKYFVSFGFIFEKDSNLSFWDKLKIAQTIWGLRFDKIHQLELGKFAGKMVLSDGADAVALDSESVDNVLANLFSEDSIVAEKLRVEVVNTTDVSGLAEKAARLLGNIGVIVVDVNSDNSSKNRCVLQTSEKLLSSLTVKRIAGIFQCETRKSDRLRKADVVVLVGKDYADTLTK